MPFTVTAQNQRHVDSLEKRLKDYETKKAASGDTSYSIGDSLKANIFLAFGQEYFEDDPEKARSYAEQVLSLSQKIGYKRGIGNGYNGIAIYYMMQGNEDSALAFHQRALAIRTEIGDKRGMAATYNNMGTVYDYRQNYPKALDYYLQALKLDEEVGSKTGTAHAATNIGNIYTTQRNYADALTMFQKAFMMDQQLKDSAALAVDYESLGLTYYYENDDSDARKDYLAALAIDEKQNARSRAAAINMNLGDLYKSEENYKEALKYYEQALEISVEESDKRQMTISFVAVGAIYETIGDLPKALENLTKGLEYATETGNMDQMSFAYRVLSVLYQKMNNYREAYHYAVLYKSLYDTLYNKENERTITKMQMQYEFDKKADSAQAVMRQNEIELKARKNQLILATTSFGIIFILGGTLFYINRKRKATLYRQNLAESEMKALRAQMNPHFMFNSLNAIQQMVLNNENDNAFRYLDTYSKLTRKILENSEQKWISLQDEIKFLQLYLQIESLRFPNTFEYEIKTDEDISVHEEKIPAMIIQPIVENAIKHGLLSKEGDKNLSISFIKPGNDGQLEVIVEDNGIGRSHAESLKAKDHQSMSMDITESRLNLLDESGHSKIVVEDLKAENGAAEGTRVKIFITQPS